MIRKIRELFKRTRRVTTETSPEHAELLANIKFPCC